MFSDKGMAEEEGFEPPIPFQVRQFSRLEPSTTRPLFLLPSLVCGGALRKSEKCLERVHRELPLAVLVEVEGHGLGHDIAV